MFGSFRRTLPTISIFHSANSQQSLSALSMLRSALTSPYPPSSESKQPLDFHLEVASRPPTADQLKLIHSFIAPSETFDAKRFLSAHPSSQALDNMSHGPGPTTEALVKLAEANPQSIKYPIVVDWDAGTAVIADLNGVKGILENLRKKRDEEVEEEPPKRGWFS